MTVLTKTNVKEKQKKNVMKTNTHSKIKQLNINILPIVEKMEEKNLRFYSLSSEQISDFIKKIPKDNLKEKIQINFIYDGKNTKKEDFLLTEEIVNVSNQASLNLNSLKTSMKENKLYENINTKVKELLKLINFPKFQETIIYPHQYQKLIEENLKEIISLHSLDKEKIKITTNIVDFHKFKKELKNKKVINANLNLENIKKTKNKLKEEEKPKNNKKTRKTTPGSNKEIKSEKHND